MNKNKAQLVPAIITPQQNEQFNLNVEAVQRTWIQNEIKQRLLCAQIKISDVTITETKWQKWMSNVTIVETERPMWFILCTYFWSKRPIWFFYRFQCNFQINWQNCISYVELYYTASLYKQHSGEKLFHFDTVSKYIFTTFKLDLLEMCELLDRPFWKVTREFIRAALTVGNIFFRRRIALSLSPLYLSPDLYFGFSARRKARRCLSLSFNFYLLRTGGWLLFSNECFSLESYKLWD